MSEFKYGDYSDADDPALVGAYRRPLSPVYRLDKEVVANARRIVKERRPGRNVAIFASSAWQVGRDYYNAAKELGGLIGERGHNVVWGGTEAGLMDVLAQCARDKGAFLLGVSYWGRDGWDRHDADLAFHAPDLMARKTGMIALSDVAITLPGGLGSFGEAGTYMERKKIGVRLPPLIMLNTNGFYDGLREQVERMESDGFSRLPPGKLVHFADTPAEAMELAETLQPPPPPTPKPKPAPPASA